MRKTFKLLSQWRAEDFGCGLVELFWMCFFGFMPLWLGCAFLRYRGSAHAEKFFFEFIQHGELLLVGVALIGPLMYPLMKQYGDVGSSVPFPMNWFFVAIIVALALLTSGLFMQLKADAISQLHDVNNDLDQGYIIVISVIGAIMSIGFTFLILCVRNLMERIDIPRYFRSDTDQVLEEWTK